MSLSVQAIYPGSVAIATPIPFTTANTEILFSAGTVTTVMTAGTNGARLDRIYFKASSANSLAGMIRIWIKPSGGTFRLISEIPVPVTTPGANAVSWEGVYTPAGAPMVLAAGCIVGVSTEKNDTFNALVSGGDF